MTSASSGLSPLIIVAFLLCAAACVLIAIVVSIVITWCYFFHHKNNKNKDKHSLDIPAQPNQPVAENAEATFTVQSPSSSYYTDVQSAHLYPFVPPTPHPPDPCWLNNFEQLPISPFARRQAPVIPVPVMVPSAPSLNVDSEEAR